MSEGIGIELPKYKCHKQVWALKIRDVICHAHPDPGVSIEEFSKDPKFSGGFLFAAEEGYAPIPFDAEWYRKHKPKPGGYYVVYQDGHKSYSPVEAFETGYTRIESKPSGSECHNCGKFEAKDNSLYCDGCEDWPNWLEAEERREKS